MWLTAMGSQLLPRRHHQHQWSAPRSAGPASAGTCTIKLKIGAFAQAHRLHLDCRSRCRTSTLVIDTHRYLQQLARTCHLSSKRQSVGQGTSCPQRFSACPSELLSWIKNAAPPPDTVTQAPFSMGSVAKRNKVRARVRKAASESEPFTAADLRAGCSVIRVCHIMVGTCTRTVAVALDHGIQQCFFAVFGNICVAISV